MRNCILSLSPGTEPSLRMDLQDSDVMLYLHTEFHGNANQMENIDSIFPKYNGPIEFIPKATDQTAQTKNRRLLDNIVFKSIDSAVVTVENDSGGYTISIA